MRLRDVAPRGGARCAADDDCGDEWWLDVVVEALSAPDPRARSPRCLAGARATPPEDVGGLAGYADCCRALRRPGHPAHAASWAWVGGAFDPACFDVRRANARLRGPWPAGHPPLGAR